MIFYDNFTFKFWVLFILQADQLAKRVDSLHAKKPAMKMELEKIRSTQTENVKC